MANTHDMEHEKITAQHIQLYVNKLENSDKKGKIFFFKHNLPKPTGETENLTSFTGIKKMKSLMENLDLQMASLLNSTIHIRNK